MANLGCRCSRPDVSWSCGAHGSKFTTLLLLPHCVLAGSPVKGSLATSDVAALINFANKLASPLTTASPRERFRRRDGASQKGGESHEQKRK